MMEKQLPLHAEDLVLEIGGAGHLGVVERTNGDVDTHLPYPNRSESDIITKDSNLPKKMFNKFMKDGVPPPGYVYVRWYALATVTLLPESRVKLMDRSLLIGDVVKRPTKEAMSGVVINASTKCTLQPLSDVEIADYGQNKLKGFLPYGNVGGVRRLESGMPAQLVDIPASELKYDEEVNEEDLIVYRDRLGRIEELTTNITLKLADNSVVEIADDAADHVDTTVDLFSVGDLASTKKATLRTGRWIYGKYSPNTPPIGTVVARKVQTAEVTWLQRRIGAEESEDPSVVLDTDDLEASDFSIYDRARYSQHQSTFANSGARENGTTSFSEIDIALGRRVRFKDLSGACVKYDGSTGHGKLQRIERQDVLGYDLNVFEVASFRTDVTVQWQDLTISRESSISLIPDTSIDDEHAAWPGEIAHTLEFTPVDGQSQMTQPKKVGVVQTVDAEQRMATLKWCPDGQLQYYEDAVDEHAGSKSLLTAIVGRAGTEEQELSLYDIEAPGLLNVRRGDIVLILGQTDSGTKGDGFPTAGFDVDWVGEIVDTCLDGSLTIRLGASQDAREVNILRECVRIAVRSDGTDQADEWDEEESEDGMDLHEDDDGNSERDSDIEYIMSIDDEDELHARYEDENDIPLDEDDVEDEEWESDASGDGHEDVDMAEAPEETPPTSHSTTPQITSLHPDEDAIASQPTDTASGQPEQYLILEGSVPSGHLFASEVAPESPTHMKRVAKEHKILRSPGALPPGVYVRSYESRLDLLRVLFVGPADTPYDSAPFVVDFSMGHYFPSDPPGAAFHSWTAENGLSGVGRVNPNLYENGKICLSLLGTWDGDKGEGWSAARSTLLQLIVSILGLVLVREPYFNEAGYEPLAGLESSRRPSALYNERTFLRSNSFIIKPLVWLKTPNGTDGSGVKGMEDVLKWLYLDPAGQRLLQKKICDLEAILEKSEGVDVEPDGITCMSKGACIPLKRVLARLKEL